MANGSRVDGLKELDKQLTALGGTVGLKILRASTRSAMLPVMKTARATVPVATEPHRLAPGYGRRLVAPGYAKRSLKIKTFKGKRTLGSVAAILGVDKTAFYAVQFWEYGTSKIPRQPWLSRAFTSNTSNILARFKKGARDRIRKAALKK